jgi:hypothetical protein
MAQSESLDEWIKYRTTDIKHPLSPNLTATFQRTLSIRKQMINQLSVLLKNELAAGMTLASLASQSRDPNVRNRRTSTARRAYDTILRLSRGGLTLPGVETKSLAAELVDLKAALRKLGEKL